MSLDLEIYVREELYARGNKLHKNEIHSLIFQLGHIYVENAS